MKRRWLLRQRKGPLFSAGWQHSVTDHVLEYDNQFSLMHSFCLRQSLFSAGWQHSVTDHVLEYDNQFSLMHSFCLRQSLFSAGWQHSVTDHVLEYDNQFSLMHSFCLRQSLFSAGWQHNVMTAHVLQYNDSWFWQLNVPLWTMHFFKFYIILRSMWRQDWYWTWQCFRCTANAARLWRGSVEETDWKFNRWLDPHTECNRRDGGRGYRDSLESIHGTGVLVTTMVSNTWPTCVCMVMWNCIRKNVSTTSPNDSAQPCASWLHPARRVESPSEDGVSAGWPETPWAS